METIKTWHERQAERGIGSCEARDEEITELRAKLVLMQAEIDELQAENRRIEKLNLKFALSVVGLASKASTLTKADEIRALLAPHAAELDAIFIETQSLEDDVISVLMEFHTKDAQRGNATSTP